MHRPCLASRCVLGIAIAVLLLAKGPVTAQAPSRPDFVPVTDAMLQDPDPATDWLMWRHAQGWGYSPLDQIDRRNVNELRLAWSRVLAPGWVSWKEAMSRW